MNSVTAMNVHSSSYIVVGAATVINKYTTTAAANATAMIVIASLAACRCRCRWPATDQHRSVLAAAARAAAGDSITARSLSFGTVQRRLYVDVGTIISRGV